MIIQESQDLHTAFLNRLKAKYRLVANRSEDGKIHLSDLTHCLTASYWDRVDYEPPTDEQALAFARGWLLEDFSISDIHVEPFEVDGVWMSVDMLLDGLPGDLKSTLLAPESSSGCAVCGEPYKGHRGMCSCGHHGTLHYALENSMGGCQYGCGCQFYTAHAYEKAPPKPFVFPVEWERRFAAYRWALNQQDCQCGHTRKQHTPPARWRNQSATRCFGPQNYAIDLKPHGGCSCLEFKVDKTSASTRFGVVVFHLIHAVVKAYELRWTPAELEDAWVWVLERKATLTRLLEEDVAEPFKYNEDYECRNCAYLLRCQLWASLHPDQYKESHA